MQKAVFTNLLKIFSHKFEKVPRRLQKFLPNYSSLNKLISLRMFLWISGHVEYSFDNPLEYSLQEGWGVSKCDNNWN